ncbi:uncharacterized protein PGTG_04714 [Puccinia graminis f. sp. tritici CRL 75-36-700-3]|uniref:Sugar phosphate phosphatase n=1 Tax=Puccinia graminis f. sp. tritici (strain CRL 75-36-700-3 / race SCCL) TaxID=418459 RepID=E3K3V6_PUCGT|nr:uncharacterized protein PGTG_04714 [Puccinia graminis f. sp. tritici CRL 75-36-700-3]EFP78758.1 hypothetical protein PGTG_04714 [Puccinia graminis f. sp. tritici CRL 75-36-700-3]
MTSPRDVGQVHSIKERKGKEEPRRRENLSGLRGQTRKTLGLSTTKSFNLSHQLSSTSNRPDSQNRRPILPPLIMASTIFPNSNHQPRVHPYSPSNKHSFAFQSVTTRWPKILTQVIDHLVDQNNQLLDRLPSDPDSQSLKAKLTQGKAIISLISELKYEAARDKELSPLESNQNYTEQENQIILLYNQELSKSKAAGKPTWFSASWLLTECYLYQRLHGFFNRHEHWKNFDPFEHQKLSSFRSSWSAVSNLCLILDRLTKQDKQSSVTDDDLLGRRAQFNELLSACLWGNATDLSLLPNMTHEEIQHLQTSSSRKPESVLRDDSAQVWQTCFDFNSSVPGKPSARRIDFVLDNAGFELFTDLVLADWIVSNSKAAQIVFHPKLIPWFVSDVMKKDIDQLLESMVDPRNFFTSTGTDQSSTNPDQTHDAHFLVVQEIGRRWKSYFESGAWKVMDSSLLSFWTNPLPFWDIASRDTKLLEELRAADLVIFKGDLNYRKLTGDAQWETETPIEEAIGPLNGLFNLLSLRTCKADVCAGLGSGKEAWVSKIDPDWRINGKFGLITFVPKKQAP